MALLFPRPDSTRARGLGAPSRSQRLVRRGAGALGILALVAATTSCDPPDLQITTAVTGLHHPWDIAFTPQGAMLVTERSGSIDAYPFGQRRVLAEPGDAVQSGEGGMMGIAVDPAFGSNRRIYTCFLSNRSGGLDVRVVRWTVNENYTALSDRADILTGIPVSSGRHSGCRTRFGPDGDLWVTTGDAARSDTAQNRQSLGGKVLRITTDGAGAPGNPGGDLRPEIYTLGHRNPQGISFRPSDGKAFEVEHGTDCDDEINYLVPGGNYGWNPGASGTYDDQAPMTDHATVANAIDPAWKSGCPTIAPSGGEFLRGDRWGSWKNNLAVAVLKGTSLQVFALGNDGGAPVAQWTSITDRGRLRIAVEGPDGDLYIATDADPGSILRVHPS